MNLDKNTILQIFGSLMKNPLLLAEVDKYLLTPQDFSTSFEKCIFAAISNLYQNGAERITVVDIDNYLSNHSSIYQVFIDNNGIEYLNDAEDLSTIENFNYYYTKLKKYNAIKDLKAIGFNTAKIYPEDNLVEDNDRESKLIKFEEMSIQDIFNIVRKDLSKTEAKYETKINNQTINAFDGIERLVKNLRNSPEIGCNLQGDIFNTIVRGARRGKFYIRSSSTGGGKSRGMVGDACYIAYPIRYNIEREKWENCGACEKVLYIGTEQKPDEIQTMILAYLSGVNEEKILYGTYSEDEEDRINKAIKVMEIYKENFLITQLPDPTITQVKTVVRKFCLVNEINNVFYDYIFSSPALLGEFRDLKIREDVVLTLLSTALKDLAAELDIFLMSATQVNAEADNNQRGIRNQAAIRGSRAIIDKCDIACFSMPITKDEYSSLEVLINKKGIKPNQVTDIYKVRRGRYTNVRIWSEVDLGICRKKDLFVTDISFNEIEDFQVVHILFNEDKIGEYDSILKLLNNGEVTKQLEETLEEKKTKIEELENSELKSIIPERSVFAGLF